jgi:hypothetical protein
VSNDDGKQSLTPTSCTSSDPTRLVVAEGHYWRVFEVPYEFDRRSGRSLVFEHEYAWRRVRNYPANWHELSEAALIALLEHT